MSKNLIRKGLAIAAAGALGISGLIALPASAAGYGVDQDKVTLAPNTGVDWAVTTGDEFTVKSRILPTATNGGELKFLVETENSNDYDSTSEFDITNYAATATSWSLVDNDPTTTIFLYFDDAHNFISGDDVSINGSGLFPSSFTGPVQDGSITNITIVNSTTLSFTTTIDLSATGTGNDDTIVTLDEINHLEYEDETNEVLIFNSRQRSAGVDVTLLLDPDTDTSADVTAFVDAGNSGATVIDSNEHASATQTITWIDADDIRVATDGLVFNQPVLGATSLSATIKTNPALNDYQSSYLPVALFSYVDRSTLLGSTTYEWGNDAYRHGDTTKYNSTTKAFSTSATGLSLEPAVYSATPYVLLRGETPDIDPSGGAAGVNAYQIGTAVSSTVVASFADALDIEVPGTADVEAEYVAGDSDGETATSLIRKGSTAAVTAFVTVYDASGDPLPNATVTLTGWTTAHTVNGAASPLVATTDANGQVRLTVVNVTSTSGTNAEVTAKTNYRGLATTIEATMVFDFGVEASYDLYNLNDNDESGMENDFSINPSQSVQMSVAALDQWGITAPSTYRIKAVTSGEVSAIATSYLTPSQSGASFSATSNGETGDNAFTVVFTLQSPSTGFTPGWTDGDTETVNVDVLNVANKVVLDSCGSDCVSDTYTDSVLRTYDSRTQNILTPNDDAYSPYNFLEGVVVDTVTGLARPYAQVTLSGANMFFIDDKEGNSIGSSSNVVKQGSITLRANSSGEYDVYVYSNKSGYDLPVTITSGSSTATQKVTFLPVNDASGADVIWQNPKSVKAGKSLTVRFKLVDDLGNPIYADDTDFSTGLGYSKVYLNYAGPGLLATGPASSNEGSMGEPDSLTGFYTARVLLGTKDYGVATFTVTYLEDEGSELNRRFVTETIRIWVGPIVDVKAGAKKGRVVVDAYRVKGQTVNVYVGKTKVGSFVADKAVDRYVVKGIKKGARNVSAKIVGPGKDVMKRVTVK